MEGLSGINQGLRGRWRWALGPTPRGPILSGNLRTSLGLKTRMKITLEVPQAGLSGSLRPFCPGPEPFVRTGASGFTPSLSFLVCKVGWEVPPRRDRVCELPHSVSCIQQSSPASALHRAGPVHSCVTESQCPLQLPGWSVWLGPLGDLPLHFLSPAEGVPQRLCISRRQPRGWPRRFPLGLPPDV